MTTTSNALRWVAVLPTMILSFVLLDYALYYVFSILDFVASIAMGSYGNGQSSPVLIRMLACGFQMFLSVAAASMVAPSKRFPVSIVMSVLYVVFVVCTVVFLPWPEDTSVLDFVLCSVVAAFAGCAVACVVMKDKDPEAVSKTSNLQNMQQ